MKLTLFLFHPLRYLIFQSGRQFPKSNKSWVPRKKKYVNGTKQEESENKPGENGRFTRCYFRAEILQIDKFWTQMILAGNQSKQRGPLHINLKNQDCVR